MKSFLLASVAVALLSLAACGGGGTIGTNPQTFTIGGTVSGLTAAGLVLQNNGGDDLMVGANGAFTFHTAVNSGNAYSVTVSAQPAGETCAVTNGSGTATANVTSVSVACIAGSSNVTISIVVSGLTASTPGLVIEDNGINPLSVPNNGTYPLNVPAGTPYNITVQTQPTGATCTVANGSGTANSNVTVNVTCGAAGSLTLSAAVTGLAGTLELQDDKGDTLTFTADGTQAFATLYASGAQYSVSGLSQPPGQTCTLGSNSTGTITANTTVAVTCSTSGGNTGTISAAVTGLTGTLVLQDDKSDTLTFTTNITQTFASSYASGATYAVSVKTQPAGQNCTLSSNATGTIAASSTTVTVTCTTTAVNYTISVAVTGLTGTLVMQDDKADTLTFTTNSTQNFATQYASGSTYTVSVKTQPTGQTCTLSSNASGTITANTTVTATCTTTVVNYTISVAVTGLTGTLVMQDDKADNLTFTTNSTQTFATSYASGSTYAVSVKTQPTGQTCTPGSNATGTITANTTVTVTCVTNTPNDTISVAVTGLTGTLVVQDDKADTLTFTTNSTQTFATSYTSGSTYTVSVKTQPTGQTCTLGSNATGTITANTTVTATCTTNVVNYTISVAVTGLTGTLVMQDDKADTLTFTTNNTQNFATQYASGSTYAVSVKTQPSGQSCTLSSNASGTITANTTVTATCTTTVVNYTLSVAVTGLTGTLVVQDSKSDTLTFTSNNTQTFATSYASGSTYSVTVQTQPSGQTCTLSSNASGTITANTTVTATCATSGGGLTVSVAVTGLSGSVTVTNDQNDTLTFNSNGTQAFSGTYTSGSTYAVYVTEQPSAQSCIPTYSTGTITSNVTINAACATGSTRKLGTVSGVSSVACSGGIKNGVCQQLTVACPGVPNVFAYVKTNAPTGASLGTVTYNTGTDGNGLYESIFTYGATAVGNVLQAGFTTAQISWGTPFNNGQPYGWVNGPGGVLAAACRYATVNQWIYDNIQNDASVPFCATANSGGSGALAYALSQYPTADILAMAEVTSGPPAGRLDWGCGCKEGSLPVQCGSSTSLGTCFGTGATGSQVWDPAYANPTNGACTQAENNDLPPGVGLDFLLGDSVEAPGAAYNLSKTHVNLVFGGADGSAAIPIGQDWFNNITSSKSQACVPNGIHSLASTLAGAQQIANDLIGMCKLQ